MNTAPAHVRGLNLHVYPSPLTHESRMQRICDSLADLAIFNKIEMAGTMEGDLPRKEMRGCVSVRRFPRVDPSGPRALNRIVRTLTWSWNVLREYWSEPLTCINCHSAAMLPLGLVLKLRHGCRIIYDAHELETEVVGAKGILRHVYRVIESIGIRAVDNTIVASDSIADWYKARYGRRPVVIRNIPDHAVPPSGKSAMLRQVLGIPDDHLLFLYLGRLDVNRRVEQFIRIFQKVDSSRHVVFMGKGALEPLIQAAAETHSNIHFHPAVPPEHVVEYATGADVGLVGVEQSCLSYYYSLPNKLFEYLLAGIPVIGNDWPEIGRLVQQFDCGWLVDEKQDDWLPVIQQIDLTAIREKRGGVARARKELTWQHEEVRLVEIYRQLLIN